MPPVTQPDDPVEPAEPPGQESETPQAEQTLIAYFFLWDNAPWGESTDAGTSASVVIEAQGAAGTNAYTARMIQREAGGSDLPYLLRLYRQDGDPFLHP